MHCAKGHCAKGPLCQWRRAWLLLTFDHMMVKAAAVARVEENARRRIDGRRAVHKLSSGTHEGAVKEQRASTGQKQAVEILVVDSPTLPRPQQGQLEAGSWLGGWRAAWSWRHGGRHRVQEEEHVAGQQEQVQPDELLAGG